MQSNDIAMTAPSANPASSRALGRGDYKTLSLAALGGALEFYDFIIYVFLADVIGALFFPKDLPNWAQQMQVYGIFAAGYLARPLGGIIMAHFGDLFGRKRMFTLSIFLMSMPTLLMGLLPTYATLGLFAPILLLILRILQGAAVGGEVPGAWVFVSEHVPSRRTGFACGTLTSGLTAGILLGSLITLAVMKIFTETEMLGYAWRIPFILGGAFGVGAMYLRRWLEETPVFLEMKQRKELAAEMPLKTVIRDYPGAIIISMLLTWLLSAGIVVVILMTPKFLKGIYHIDPATAQMANCFATVTLSIGCVVAGSLIDRFGAKRTFMAGSILLAACTYAFYTIMFTHPGVLIPLYMLAGFTVGLVGAVPYVMIHAFAPKIRFSGLSFAYNVSYAIFGGLTLMVVPAMLKYDNLGPAHYVLGVCAMAFVTSFFLPKKPFH